MSLPAPKRASSQRDFARGMNLAMDIAASVLIFWLMGLGLERWADVPSPWAQLVGVLVGWVLGAYHVYLWTRGDRG